MARRSKRKSGLTVGLVGSGKSPAKAIKQHLSDFVEAQDGEITWVFPLTENSPKSLTTAVNTLFEDEAVYGLVVDGTTTDEDLSEHAKFEEEHEEDAHLGVIEHLKEVEGDTKLIILLDENQESDLDLLDAADEAKIEVLDLCSALAVIELESTDAADEPEDEDEDEPEAAEDDADEEEETSEGDDLPVPAEALKAIEDGDADSAITLLKAFTRENLVSIAEKVGLDIPKGVHRKTIATDIVGKISEDLGGGSSDDAADEPEDAPEETPKRSRKKAGPEETSEPEPNEGMTKVSEVKHDPSVSGEVHPRVVEMLAGIAASNSTEEAEKFFKFGRANNMF